MYCSHCGKETDENAYFCSYCGKPIKNMENRLNEVKASVEKIDFFRAIKKVVFEKYIDFDGRASRSEYWWYSFGVALFTAAFATLFVLVSNGNYLFLLYFLGLVSLILFLPSLALSVRRLHDINKSGWWYLINYIPLIGPILILIWSITKGNEENNNYGIAPNVKSVGSPIIIVLGVILLLIFWFTTTIYIVNSQESSNDFFYNENPLVEQSDV